ncbi:hypothetical protein [Streptomyces liliifuscus]|uniref:Uncharacterized protein n=1 Tax=Streptomyces liliifuscus TaxID=2797636 RepID=A0A7T7I0W3_9ACTN|nr:hypothetical protein [Streptomyces liliifuscus]QQM38986.1 hypothetical protein JEQ17_05535 [Streptomyces liliifuscus]
MSDTGHPTPGRPAQDGGGVHIGSMSGGSIATGSQGSAYSVNHTAAEPDVRHEELLGAIRALREALPARERSAEDTTLDGELADAEAEITRTGAAGPERLTRLLTGVRGWLGSQAAAAGAIASATAVVQGIAQLLG